MLMITPALTSRKKFKLQIEKEEKEEKRIWKIKE